MQQLLALSRQQPEIKVSFPECAIQADVRGERLVRTDSPVRSKTVAALALRTIFASF